MPTKSNRFRCLYYPFSRLLDESTLKYLLLAFDEITFLDDVDPDWRTYQLRLMSREDPTFSAYETLRTHYDSLGQENIIRILDARDLAATNSESAAHSTIADLNDAEFLRIASAPQSYSLPARMLGDYGLAPANKATWQIFYGKIAKPLLENDEFLNDEMWAGHILVPGTKNHHWTLSYEAGSSVALNFYLEAADELNLTPVTTSGLHHQLILRKLKRVFIDDKPEVETLDDFARQRFRAVISQGEIIRLFQQLFPVSQLDGLAFDEIIKFRKSTSELREKFVQEIDNSLRMIGSDPDSVEYDSQVAETIEKMRQQFIELNNEMKAVRDRFFPALVKALTFGAAGGSALSAGMTFLGGLSNAGLVAASALPIAGSLMASSLELWNIKRSAVRSQPPSVIYLAKISKLLK